MLTSIWGREGKGTYLSMDTKSKKYNCMYLRETMTGFTCFYYPYQPTQEAFGTEILFNGCEEFIHRFPC